MPRVQAIAAALFVLVLFCAALPTASAQSQASPQAGETAQYAPLGAETCLKCHDDSPVTDILGTAHARSADKRTPFARQDCEACHGVSPEHLEKPAPGATRAPVKRLFGQLSTTPVAEQNGACLQCHQGNKRINWSGSQHQFADIPCASCHRIHAREDRVLSKRTETDVCFTCHKTQRAQIHRLSSHPIDEKQMACSDCHNPHGSFGPRQLVKTTVNDTCYQCHAEKRGPFLWEHAPVREDCTNCHNPHGSTQPSLLKARTPGFASSVIWRRFIRALSIAGPACLRGVWRTGFWRAAV
ncbi:DmsE family decaheme c-type cytochrome [Marinobacterium aestuariivivens]|uniref:DmsE family decaheme c-type cytochrome n=1 Tax=Marinobacterium aestuariivivens TaxID=1698799 RepID=A0ABW2A7U0_9GAMM